MSYLIKVGNFRRKDRDRLVEHIHIAQKSGKEIVWLRSSGAVVDYLQKVRQEVQREQRQPVEAALAGK